MHVPHSMCRSQRTDSLRQLALSFHHGGGGCPRITLLSSGSAKSIFICGALTPVPCEVILLRSVFTHFGDKASL